MLSTLATGQTPAEALVDQRELGGRPRELSEDPATMGGGVNLLAIQYLNRLSDLLFIMSRRANGDAEVLWVPGGERNPGRPKN